MGKANNIIRIPTSIDGKFFRYWFEFLKPLHPFTDKEIEVISCYLKYRYDLCKVIKDEDILNKVLMSTETKNKIREECGMSIQHFQSILGKLKRGKVIIDNRINPRFIPNVTADKGAFNLLIYFDLQ